MAGFCCFVRSLEYCHQGPSVRFGTRNYTSTDALDLNQNLKARFDQSLSVSDVRHVLKVKLLVINGRDDKFFFRPSGELLLFR